MSTAGTACPGTAQKRAHDHSQHSEQEPADETPEERKKRKKAEANANRQRYKDYNKNAELKRVFKLTGDLLKVEWMCRNAYPSEEEEALAIKSRFAQVLRDRGHPSDWYELSDKDIKLLEQEDTAMRSRVRAAAAQLVPQAYHLNAAPENDAERAENMRIARTALTDSRFAYADPIKLEGRFQSALITNVIHKAFFAVSSSIGCIYQDLLDPIPSRLIALAVTAIHHILSWYQDGDCKTTPFTNEKWAEYDAFVNAVEQFEQGDMARLWRAHRHRVLTRCLSLAGVVQEKIREPPIKPVSDDVLQREKERLESIYGQLAAENPPSPAPFSPHGYSFEIDPTEQSLAWDGATRGSSDGIQREREECPPSTRSCSTEVERGPSADVERGPSELEADNI